MPIASHYTFVAAFEGNHGGQWSVLFDQDWDIKACSYNGNGATTRWHGLRGDIILANAIKRCDMPALDLEASHYEDCEELQDNDDEIDFINSTIPYYD